MRNLFVSALCFLGAVGASLAAQSETVLIFQKSVATHTEGGKGSRASDEKSDREITIGFGNDYFYVTEDGLTRRCDFGSHRLIVVQRDKKTFEDWSLFAIIGYREAEFRNRLMLRDALKAGSVTYPWFDTFELEMLFSLSEKSQSKLDLTVSQDGAVTSFDHAGEKVAEFNFSDKKLSPERHAVFQKYLLYECNLHPAILAALLSREHVPEFLRYRFKNADKVTDVSLALKAMKENGNPAPAIPPGYTAAGSSEAAKQIGDLANKGMTMKETAEKKLLIVATDALNKGQHLEALLAALELNLQTGKDTSEQIRKIAPFQNEDVELGFFLHGLDTSSKERAAASCKSLDSIHREGLTRGHVIDIMKGDAEMALGNLQEAKKLFLTALAANPSITGVYKDLGDVFYAQYEMQLSWLCWDSARKLYPQQSILKGISELEHQLVKDHPEYFL